MSVSTSDDASDTFWPGYVDAVTNLAINLLFVVAVMSIVVIAMTMQMAEMTKRKIKETQTQATQQNVATSDEFTIAQLQQQLNATTKKLAETEKRLSQKEAAAPDIKKLEVVNIEKKSAPNNNDQSKSSMAMQAVAGGGLILKFPANSVEISEQQAQEINKKLNAFGDVTRTVWQIEVIYPEGYSEAHILAFNRAMAVKNILLQNHIDKQNIKPPKIMGSTAPEANNQQVLVRPAP